MPDFTRDRGKAGLKLMLYAMGRRIANPKSEILFVREPSAVGSKPSAANVRKVIIAE